MAEPPTAPRCPPLPTPAPAAPPPQFCKAKLSCPIAPDLLPEEAAAAGERFLGGLSAAHDAACPWRAATSAASLLQFPPLTQVGRAGWLARTARRLTVCRACACADRCAAGGLLPLGRQLLQGVHK